LVFVIAHFSTPPRSCLKADIRVIQASVASNGDTGGEFISRRIDEPIRRMIGGIQDPSCCL
jgi:hypothetical protein